MELRLYKTSVEAQHVKIANYVTIRKENLPTISTVCQLVEFMLMGIKNNNKIMYLKEEVHY
jgi:hypothetical protein